MDSPSSSSMVSWDGLVEESSLKLPWLMVKVLTANTASLFSIDELSTESLSACSSSSSSRRVSSGDLNFNPFNTRFFKLIRLNTWPRVQGKRRGLRTSQSTRETTGAKFQHQAPPTPWSRCPPVWKLHCALLFLVARSGFRIHTFNSNSFVYFIF